MNDKGNGTETLMSTNVISLRKRERERGERERERERGEREKIQTHTIMLWFGLKKSKHFNSAHLYNTDKANQSNSDLVLETSYHDTVKFLPTLR